MSTTASGEEHMSTILSEEKEWDDEANARRAHARMIANALAVLSVVAAVAFTGTIVMLKLRRRKPKPQQHLAQQVHWQSCERERGGR